MTGKFALILFVALTSSVFAQEAEITLEKIWKSGEFSARSVSGIRSMNDGIHYTSMARDESGGQYIIKHAYDTGAEVDTLLRPSDIETDSLENFSFAAYSFNDEENRLLLATAYEPIYRRSSRANYFAFDMGSGTLAPITDFSLGKQSLAAFSPVGNQVAFVRDNDIYIADLDAGSEIRVTDDGEKNKIINGAVDWVYEEEFSFHRGFYWSPEGTKIAYYRFDESEVREFSMAIYGGLYPQPYDFKYPKAGEKNSEVRILVYDLASQKSRDVRIDPDPEQYIPRIKWTKSDNELCVMRMNRRQSHLEFLLADTRAKSADIPVTRIYDERSDTYLEVNDNLIFLDDGKHFIWNSERDGWNHIYAYALSGKEVGRLTMGKWEVIDFYGVDQENETVYFSAAMESPLEQAVYSVHYGKIFKTGKSSSLKPVQLTRNSGVNTATFSSNYTYFINFESHADVPPRVSLCFNSGEEIRLLEDNQALKSRLEEYKMSPKTFGSFTTEAGHSLNYWMIKPYDFDPDKSYPLMFMIYGGPGKNTVSKKWDYSNYMWHQMLAQQGYVVVSVDPRGTMRRGRDFKHSTYLNLGKLETEDFISAAKHFGAETFVDANRIGMMGWSYGGYMTSLCMTKGAEYFKLGVAVAPVTNWRYYDTIYAERFLRTPQENPEGFDENSPINHVDKLKGHYLLVHGAADDNVHYQNSMEMVTALVNADKQFELMIYPNKNHFIYGGNTRHHLYTKMTDFIKTNL
ncbi:MAG: S9 family peptidase [Cryomorphaceae bacterium]